MTETNRQKIYDLSAQSAELCQKANEAFDAQDVEKGKDYTAQAKAINDQLDGLRALEAQESRLAKPAPMAREEKDQAEERVEALLHGGSISFTPADISAALGLRISNSTTLATGTLLEPTRTGTTIRESMALSPVSSIVDQVTVQDLTGCQAIQEPLLLAEMDAHGAKVTTAAGTLRQTSKDPTFGAVKIQPYEVTVTSFVDRNLSRLTPIAYEEKIRSLAMKALRRTIAGLIYNGDGQASPDMYGIKTAKDVNGRALAKTVDLSKIEAGFLDKLVYAYGSDEEVGGAARLYLNKKDLQAIGALRNSESKKIYEIVPDPANANTGRIIEGGLIVPYTIGSALTALTGSNATSGPVIHMLYGDPTNYELGLFGNYTIRIDESYKAGERMNTILGDVFVGGNLIVDQGFILGNLPKG